MPIYEYICQDCNQEFEWLSRADEQPVCPSCGKSQLSKKFSVPAAHTSGSPEMPCRETGTCNPGNCCGQGCNLPGMM